MMKPVIPVILNGEVQLIDEAEVRNICARENIPYDSPNDRQFVDQSSLQATEVRSEGVQVDAVLPQTGVSFLNAQHLALIQPGNQIVPITSQGFASVVGNTIYITDPNQFQIVPGNSLNMIYSAQGQLSQGVPQVLKFVGAPLGKEGSINGNVCKILQNRETLSPPQQSEFLPDIGLKNYPNGITITLEDEADCEEVCEVFLTNKGQTHRVIVPMAYDKIDIRQVSAEGSRVLMNDDVNSFLASITHVQKLLPAKVNRPLSDAAVGSSDADMNSSFNNQNSGTISLAQIDTQPVVSSLSEHNDPTMVTSSAPVVLQSTVVDQSQAQILTASGGQMLVVAQPQVVGSPGMGQLFQVTQVPATAENVLLNATPKPVTTNDGSATKTFSNGVKPVDDQSLNQLVDVIYTFCDTCGYHSRDQKICMKCRRPLPKDAKTIIQKTNLAYAQTPNPARIPEEFKCFVAVRCNCCGRTSVDIKICTSCKTRLPENSPRILVKVKTNMDTSDLRSDGPKRRKCQRKKKSEDPSGFPNLKDQTVTLSLLSSDEDGEGDGEKKEKKLPDVVSKEPIITEDTKAPWADEKIEGGGPEVADILGNPSMERAMLSCRTVRVGSYKTIPDGKVVISEYGLIIRIPSLETNELVDLVIYKQEIVKVLANFGVTIPVLFYYTTAKTAEKIRSLLSMSQQQPRGPYYDPTSSVEMYRRITLLPDKVPEESRLFLKEIYNRQCLLEPLSTDEANSILIKASPNDQSVDQQGSHQNPSHCKDNYLQQQTPATPGSHTNSGAPKDVPIQAIMVYPPPPAKGGISINTEDYGCLGEENFLNDIIIDFYLSYFVRTQLTPEDQKRTHLFSSFFYKRLTNKIPPRPDDKQSAAERRHHRVRGWTKQVDLFSKDFVIIPLNENSHWFLGVVCFPGLTQAARVSDGKPVPNPSKRLGKIPSIVGGTTITKVSTDVPTIMLEPDEEDRDEADADDEDLEPNSSGEEDFPENVEGSELIDDATHPIPKPKVKKEPQEPIKQPCILIFDSLMGASRSKVCATLREYLQVEYNIRHRSTKGKREFNKNTMKASVVKVPQQTNFTDCGLYVLQYVEAFFQSPITDYRMPISQLTNWFDTSVVSKKRYQIQQLLHKLMEEQNVDTSKLNLPVLNLRPEGTDKVYHDDEDEEMDPDMDVDEFDEMEDEMMEEEYEEEDEEIEEYRRTITGVGKIPVTQPENIRARLQRKDISFSPAVSGISGSSISLTPATPSPSKVTSSLPGKPAITAVTPSVPSSISLHKVLVDHSTLVSTAPTAKPPVQLPPSKLDAISITSSSGASTAAAKRKLMGIALKDVRNPRLQTTPSPTNKPSDTKKVRTD